MQSSSRGEHQEQNLNHIRLNYEPKSKFLQGKWQEHLSKFKRIDFLNGVRTDYNSNLHCKNKSSDPLNSNFMQDDQGHTPQNRYDSLKEDQAAIVKR